MTSNLHGLVNAVEDYDPEKDIEETGGSLGIHLAERILRATHGNPRFFGLDWKNIAEIALPRFPELQRGERICREELRKRLSALREAGFPVKRDHQKMSQQGMYNYLMDEIRPSVVRMARQYCPEVVREIQHRNYRARETSRL
ncbi:MAG: hypothetical protein AABX79_00890 [Nanoarchaeota archaeon]